MPARTDMDARYRVKCRLIRLLFARQWDNAMIREFFAVMDWMMSLPPELETKLNYFVNELEEEQEMEYVTSIERVRLAVSEQRGKQETQSKMLLRLLTRRFGDLATELQERIKNAADAQIEAWFDAGIEAKTLGEVFKGLSH